MLFWKNKTPSHERAMEWFKANMVPGQGIIVHTKQPVPYPEVTGYFIPTLYNWDEKELACTCTRWLMSIQSPDGASFDELKSRMKSSDNLVGKNHQTLVVQSNLGITVSDYEDILRDIIESPLTSSSH